MKHSKAHLALASSSGLLSSLIPDVEELTKNQLWLVKPDIIEKLKELKSLIENARIDLKKDESKQPQQPDFANTVLGEVPPVVNDGTEEHLKAVEGATPVVRQNEQTKEGLPRKECNDCGNFWYGNERCPECFSMG